MEKVNVYEKVLSGLNAYISISYYENSKKENT